MKDRKIRDDEIVVRKADLLALKVRAEIGPLVHSKGYHPLTTDEWVHRYIESGMVDISSDGSLKQHLSVAEWLSDAADDPRNAYLTQTSGDQKNDERRDSTYGGLSRDEYQKLSPRAKLDLANRQTFKQAKAD